MPKFYYERNQIVFFITYQGTRIEILRAVLHVADFNEIQRLQRIANDELIELMAHLKAVKQAA